MKPTSEIFKDAKAMMKSIKAGKSPKHPHYEISFQNKKDFNKFVKNLFILILILKESPTSIYNLAKISGMNVSNLRRITSFFEGIGAIKIEEKILDGRTVKRPIVDYDKIEFDLKAS